VVQVVRAVGAYVLRGLLPYPDPFRRRRVRKAARRLVVCDPWPADDAITGPDVAQLALLRLLWLQGQTRRASRGRHRESAVLLARSSLETCILGLYCLHCPDAVADLRAANIKAGGKMLAVLGTAGVIPQEVINQALAALGPRREGPTVRAMTKLIDAETGGTVEAALYDRLYVPTSTYFVHSNAASLLRHVKADGSLTYHPIVPWARRSPIHLADGCVGLLAGAVAHADGAPINLFLTYAETHHARTMMPLLVMAAKGLGRSSLKPARLIETTRIVLDLRRYLSGPALSDPPRMREARLRAAYDKLPLDPDVPAEAFRPVIDYFIEKILSDFAAPAADHATGYDKAQNLDGG